SPHCGRTRPKTCPPPQKRLIVAGACRSREALPPPCEALSGTNWGGDMIRTLLALALAAAFLATTPAGAQAPAPRVALVIGDAAYQSANGIATAAADATIVAETMRTAGYDVTELHDLVAADFGQQIRTFLDKVYAAGPEAVAFVYFGGYGAQFDGENY